MADDAHQAEFTKGDAFFSGTIIGGVFAGWLVAAVVLLSEPSDLAKANGEGVTAGYAKALKDAAEDSAREARLFTVPDRQIARGGAQTGSAAYDWQPPYAMQASLLAAAYFATPAEVRAQCHDVNAVACETQDGDRKPLLILPSPCRYKSDPYAWVVCHELGHAHGWPGDHRGGHFISDADENAADAAAAEVIDNDR